jgi:hypothetical protein
MSTWFGSSAQATDRRIAGTDQSQIVTQRGLLINPGGVAYTGKSGNTTFKIAKGATVSFMSNAADLADAALTKVGELGDKFMAAVSGLQSDAQQRDSAQLAKLTELSESKQTDGESSRNDTILWIVLGLAVAGVLAVRWWRK